MHRLWAGALKILEKRDQSRKQPPPPTRDPDTDDKNHKGRVHIAGPRDVDTDDKNHTYCVYITALIEKRAQNSVFALFIRNCERFLLITTYPSLLNSLAVDTYVDSLYNFISGANDTTKAATKTANDPYL
jgi:hypothetical protein